MTEIKVGQKVEYERRINHANGFEIVMRYGTVTQLWQGMANVKPPNKHARTMQIPVSRLRPTTRNWT